MYSLSASRDTRAQRLNTILGLLNISFPWQIKAQEETTIISWRELFKKVRPARPQPF
jgi:hypothetical protein